MTRNDIDSQYSSVGVVIICLITFLIVDNQYWNEKSRRELFLENEEGKNYRELY